MSERNLQLMVGIVAAYVSTNSVRADDFVALIADVNVVLDTLRKQPGHKPAEALLRPTPSQIRQSIEDERLISFEDGRSYKVLVPHLKARNLSPKTYRRKWGLPSDYPMVAPALSRQRSASALASRLGGRSPSRLAFEGTRSGAEAAPKRTS